MTPDIDLQLQTVINALAKVVTPAIDPANKLAVEQCQLSIATLGMVRSHLPMLRTFTRAQLQDGIGLAQEIAANVQASTEGSLYSCINDAQLVLKDPIVETDTIEAARAKLNNCIAQVIRDANDEQRTAIEATVLDKTQVILGRFRAWFRESGFEANPPEMFPPSPEEAASVRRGT